MRADIWKLFIYKGCISRIYKELKNSIAKNPTKTVQLKMGK
jgi:hypothetical protein